jgi:hypothetical protein
MLMKIHLPHSTTLIGTSPFSLGLNSARSRTQPAGKHQ